MKTTILPLSVTSAVAAFAQSVGEKTGVNSAFGITKTGVFHQGSCYERHARDRSANIAQQKGAAAKRSSRSR
jgi:hypothetical protein